MVLLGCLDLVSFVIHQPHDVSFCLKPGKLRLKFGENKKFHVLDHRFGGVYHYAIGDHLMGTRSGPFFGLGLVALGSHRLRVQGDKLVNPAGADCQLEIDVCAHRIAFVRPGVSPRQPLNLGVLHYVKHPGGNTVCGTAHDRIKRKLCGVGAWKCRHRDHRFKEVYRFKHRPADQAVPYPKKPGALIYQRLYF